MEKIILLLMLTSLYYSQSCYAAENLSLRGTLIEPPECTINNDVPIIVDFGPAVGISKVDGNNYKQKIKFRFIACGPSPEEIKWKTYMKLTGNGVTWDNRAVKTDNDNLAILIYHDGIPFELDESTFIASAGYVVLEAVPIKKVGAKLTEGAFSAVATLQVEMQ